MNAVSAVYFKKILEGNYFMATPSEWLNLFQVNSGTAAAGTQNNPKIVGLENGGFVVVWEEASNGAIGTSPGVDLIAKVYNAVGSVVRGAFQLNVIRNVDDERDFDLTATHDGFAVAFMDIDGARSSVVYQRYDLTGTMIRTEILADEASVNDGFSDPQLAANLIAANDDVFVAYNDLLNGDRDINARVISDIFPPGAEFGAAQNSPDLDLLGDVAVLSNGNYVTVYEEDDFGTRSLEFSIRTAAGAAVGFGQSIAASGRDVSVSGLADGGFVVVYNVATSNDVFARVFNGLGVPLSGAVTVATGPNIQNLPTVVALRDGDFAVLWNDISAGAVFGRRFNPDGTADGGTFTLALGFGLSDLDVSTTADGRILFTGTGNTGEVVASIWDPRPADINPDDYGTATANFLGTDVITTTKTGSVVSAGAKGDTILGQNGDDRIFSSGDGTFRGGGGNDTIYAHEATSAFEFELLDGGAGSEDWLIATSFTGNYGVDLNTGVTTIDGAVFAAESFIGFENISTGIGDDSIVGTNGANYIILGLGNDTVSARNGDDTVLGGNGDDLIFANGGGINDVSGGNGDDRIFSSGSGSYRGDAGNDTIFSGVGLSETLDGGGDDDTLNTNASTVDYNINLVTGVTNFAPESFINFENILTGTGNDTITGTSGANLINTGAGNDSIDGGLGADTIFAGDGDDIVTSANNSSDNRVFGGAGNDVITSSGRGEYFGEAGDDRLIVANGTNETLDGGTGNDTLDASGATFNYVINLTTGLTNFAGEVYSGFENVLSGGLNDELRGTLDANLMDGGDGDDRILAFAGNDTLIGGLGEDTLNGGEGDDSLEGGDGDDRIFAEAGNDTLEGGAGNDLLEGKIGDDRINGGLGNDTLRGSDGVDNIDGGIGDDLAFGGSGADTLFGDEGNDTLDGSSGDDFIDGWNGDDVLVGETGNDDMLGFNGNDTMRGGGGNDTMNGEADDDLMFGSAGEDSMFGGSGNDTMDGDTQSDELFGGAGNDILRGGDGFDFLDGGDGNDILAGGNGNDRLNGGAGQDTLRGNGQNDTYVFDSAFDSTFLASDLIDNIQGVGAAGGDVIDLSGIDANTLVGGDQAFTFLGFQSTLAGLGFGAGGLWLETSGNQSLLYGNTDGGNDIDFALRINDGPGITASDYILGDFIV